MSQQNSKIEAHGINQIPENERYGKPSDLFPIWFSWNISIFGITLGIYVYSLGLSVWQAMATGILGYIISCALVGIIAIPSVRMGLPSLTVSRCTFGLNGNRIPTTFGAISNVGWQIIQLSMAATTLAALLAHLSSSLQKSSSNITNSITTSNTDTLNQAIDLISPNNTALALAFAIVITLTVIGAVFGYQLIVKVEKYIALITGVMTVIYLFFFIPQIDFAKVFSAGQAPGDFGVFIGGTIMAMTMVGLGFLNFGGDYARYLPAQTSGVSVTFWTTLGIALPVSCLLVLGVLLSVGNDALLEKAAQEPLAALTTILPFWFYVPFSLVVILSLMSASMTSLYSSGLALLALGVPLSRALTTFITAILIALGCFYLTFISESFLSTFTSFLATISVIMGAWGAIMICDMWRLKQRNWSIEGSYAQAGVSTIRKSAVIALAIASFIGLGTIVSADPYIALFTGYFITESLQDSIFTSASIGVVLSMFCAAVIYIVLNYILKLDDKIKS